MKLFNNRNLAEEEVDKIIKEVDHNMSGSIDFTGIPFFVSDLSSQFSIRIYHCINDEGEIAVQKQNRASL